MPPHLQLRAWSERVVHGATLADKLTPPGRLVDTEPGPSRPVPRTPARPPELATTPPGERPSLPALPGPGALEDPAARAALLRRFAHHELQALELMGAMLLRFPDADPDWRRGLAATMRDEQRHLTAYLDRAAQLDPHAAPLPGSRFFWDLLADTSSPDRFVAGMALTLEQANLDFLSAWRTRLDAVGDADTVAVLDEVYRDEVRHVRHGVTWLSAWAEPDQDLFTAWTQRLQPPLTPRRGRGPHFDLEGRRRAGLPESFITRVRAAGASKGRTPRLVWFAPQVEEEHRLPGYTPPRALRQLTADLAPTLAALCGEDDVLALPRTQDPSFVAGLAARGWPVPQQIALPDESALSELSGPFRALSPWGWSATRARRTASLSPQRAPAWHPDTAALARKDLAARVLGALPQDPRLDLQAGLICRTLDQVHEARARWERTVVKLPWSAAGRGLLHDPTPRSLERALEAHGTVIVEPWRERVLDLSLQARITDQGVQDAQIVRFLTSSTGGFRGVAGGAWRRGLPREILRFLSGDGKDPRFVHDRLVHALQAALEHAPGHRGPVGVDALVARIDGELRLRPLVELNPRHTFGRVGRAVGQHLLARGRAGAWLHLTRAELPSGWSFAELAAWLAQHAPARGTPLIHGALPTTDPARCVRVWTVLLAGDTVEQAISLLPPCTP